MKLLIATGIYPPEIGGPAGYVRGLATELVARGHQVNVVTYGTDETENGRGFGVTVIPRTFGPLVRYCRYALAVRRLARKVDLVFLQGPVSEGLPGAIGAMLAGKKYVLKVVGDYAWEQYQQKPIKNYELRIKNFGLELLDEFLTHRHRGKVWLMEAIERWVASRTRSIIVPSKYLKTVVEHWGIDPQKIKVVYNSISPLPLSVIPAKAGIHPIMDSSIRANDNAESLKIVLTVVRAVPWKGGDFLCDCLKELPPEYRLVIVGDGPSLDEWKRHAQEIGVANRVQWPGRLSREAVTSWYRQADIFVLATGYEGFPHVVIEACSVGLPCIVSDRGGNPETKNFFPDLVTVAPYLDKSAWVEAIKNGCHSEGSRSDRENLRIETSRETDVVSFSRMVDETFEILKSNI